MIKAVTWGWNSYKGAYLTSDAEESLNILLKRVNLTHVILAFGAVQTDPFSTEVIYNSGYTPSKEEIVKIIRKIHQSNKKVILKPTLNCLDGTWRAHINFFDIDVPCEPKWEDWFASYNSYILEFAKIAQKEKCDMFVIGCEMVQTTRREKEWRTLISLVRKIYSGKISYNCDKYQEENIKWWDALDYISSSGYYPLGTWEKNLKRIKKTVEKYEKPFMFMEVGCPSVEGNSTLPNKWDMKKIPNMTEQKDFFEEVFNESFRAGFVSGYGIWDWPIKLYSKEDAEKDCDYSFFGKLSEVVIKKYFK